MNIIISSENVFKKVCSEVFYRGEVKRGENVDVAAIAQMSEDDKAVFNDLFEDAAGDALEELMIWHNPNLSIDGDAKFEVCPPASWPMMVEELTKAIEVFMVHKIVNRWMYMLGIGAEDFTKSDALKIRMLLTKREKPL